MRRVHRTPAGGASFDEDDRAAPLAAYETGTVAVPSTADSDRKPNSRNPNSRDHGQAIT